MAGLFVYGSLMTGFWNYQEFLADANLGEVKKARIKGTLYHLSAGYPALKEGNDWVYGEYYEVESFDAMLVEQLDELEGHYGEENPKNLYNREVRTIEVWNDDTKNYEEKTAFVYAYNQSVDTEMYIPHGDWRVYVKEN